MRKQAIAQATWNFKQKLLWCFGLILAWKEVRSRCLLKFWRLFNCFGCFLRSRICKGSASTIKFPLLLFLWSESMFMLEGGSWSLNSKSFVEELCMLSSSMSINPRLPGALLFCLFLRLFTVSSPSGSSGFPSELASCMRTYMSTIRAYDVILVRKNWGWNAYDYFVFDLPLQCKMDVVRTKQEDSFVFDMISN